MGPPRLQNDSLLHRHPGCLARKVVDAEVLTQDHCHAGVIVLLSLIGLVVAGAFLLGKRGGRLDAMRADAAVR